MCKWVSDLQNLSTTCNIVGCWRHFQISHQLVSSVLLQSHFAPLHHQQTLFWHVLAVLSREAREQFILSLQGTFFEFRPIRFSHIFFPFHIFETSAFPLDSPGRDLWGQRWTPGAQVRFSAGGSGVFNGDVNQIQRSRDPQNGMIWGCQLPGWPLTFTRFFESVWFCVHLMP